MPYKISYIVWYIRYLINILGHCRIIKGKDSKYKLFWSGNSKGNAGVGVFVAENRIVKVFEVKQVSDGIILVSRS